LVPDQSPETDKLATEEGAQPASLSWGTALFEDGSSIVFHIGDHPKPLVVKPGHRITLGRTDVANGPAPDVDLLPYGALSKGVSRKHAIIERANEGLLLIDLASRNSTYLNGQRLLPLQGRVLRDGDEIRLGALPVRVYFHKPNASNYSGSGSIGMAARLAAHPVSEQIH
jgi:hypothetical protein